MWTTTGPRSIAATVSKTLVGGVITTSAISSSRSGSQAAASSFIVSPKSTMAFRQSSCPQISASGNRALPNVWSQCQWVSTTHRTGSEVRVRNSSRSSSASTWEARVSMTRIPSSPNTTPTLRSSDSKRLRNTPSASWSNIKRADRPRRGPATPGPRRGHKRSTGRRRGAGEGVASKQGPRGRH